MILLNRTDVSSALKTDEMVSLYGDNIPDGYKVQRTLLTSASPWFVKGLDGQFQEARNLRLRFADTTQDTLELFLCWLFTRNLPS